MYSPAKWIHLPYLRVSSYAAKARRLIPAIAIGILGPCNAPPWWAKVEPEYRDEVRLFSSLCGNLCPPLDNLNLIVHKAPIPVALLGENVLGLCRSRIENLVFFREVILNADVHTSAAQERATLWHEFFHCIAGSDHVEQGDFDLMAPYDYSREFYEKNWDALVEATFCRLAEERLVERKGCDT